MTNPAVSVSRHITQALDADSLELPTLPEVAMDIREVAERSDVTVPMLIAQIEQDPALSAQLVKVANSPLFRATATIRDLRSAVSRMGTQYSATLAIGLAMRQMFQATSEMIDRELRKVWAHACEVAALSGVLSEHFTSLRKDQAILAGLTHSIGMLPVLTWAEQNPGLIEDSLTLHRVIELTHGHLGSEILRRWRFPDEIAQVPANYACFDRTPRQVDLVDVVMASHLLVLDDSDHPHVQAANVSGSAFERLGFDPEEEEGPFADLAGEIAEVRAGFV